MLAVVVYFGQRNLMYLPDRSSPDPSVVPLTGILEVETVTEDGLRLRHWYVPGGEGTPVVVVFHGNAGNIEGRAFKFREVAEAGFGLFLAEYRGYGGNTGQPSETGLMKDARSVLNWLNEREIRDPNIVLYGESLGSGVAVALAVERDPGAVVLESAFTSAAELAQIHYWYLPARWLIKDRFEIESQIDRIEAPILIIHGSKDTIVPLRLGRRLHAAAPEPKTLKVIEGAGHLGLWDRDGYAATRAFLEEHFDLADQRGRAR